MSIQNQAIFWERSVCDISDERIKNFSLPDKLTSGLRAFSECLRTLYADYKTFKISTAEKIKTKIGILQNDLEDYHYLTDTAFCLYAFAAAGTVKKDGDTGSLVVEKQKFKQIFKKPINKYLPFLANHAFYFHFFKQGQPAKTYATCDTFQVFYERNSQLLPAIKYLSDRLPQTEVKKDYAPPATIFLMADFETIIGKNSPSREAFSPLHPNLLGLIPDQQTLWKNLVGKLCQERHLQTNISVNTYVFPNWIVKFTQKKKTICTFHIQYNQIYLCLPLSYEAAKVVIDKRNSLPETIQKAIQNFGCVSCGKCANQSNLETYSGFSLCRLPYKNFITESSRMIQFWLTNKEEAEAICQLIEKIQEFPA